MRVLYKRYSLFDLPSAAQASQQLRDKLEISLKKSKREQVKSALVNWGAWQRENNVRPINEMTGVRNISLSAILMRYAPKQDKTGYYAEPPMPIDSEAGATMGLAVKQLSADHQRELFRFYVELQGCGEHYQKLRRYTAIDRLIELFDSRAIK